MAARCAERTRAAVPGTSARRAGGAPSEPGGRPAAVRPKTPKSGSAVTSGSRREEAEPDPGPPHAGDSPRPAASEPALPGEGRGGRRGARSAGRLTPPSAAPRDLCPGREEGAPTEPAATPTARPRALKGGRAGTPGTGQKEAGRDPRERAERSARGDGDGDFPEPAGAAAARAPEGPAAAAAPETSLPRERPAGRRGARSVPRPRRAAGELGPPESEERADGGPPQAVRPKTLRRGPARTSGSRRKEELEEEEEGGGNAADRPPEGALGGSLPADPAPPAAQSPAAEPTPPAEGARGRRGARSVRRPAEAAPRPAGTRAAPAGCDSRRLQEVLRKLRLRRDAISAAALLVNRVAERLLRRLQRSGSAFRGVEPLRTGSYYERVKVSVPNEFDIMFKLKAPRMKLEKYGTSGEHYFVKFKRNPKGDPLDEFLEGELLSASKMLFTFRTIIEEEIKNIEDIEIAVEMKKPGSPAVTLLISQPEEISVDIVLSLESEGSWPESTLRGLPIQNWRGAKCRTELRRMPFYLVPKHAKEGDGFQEETWRLSFSNVEKKILLNHGQKGICCESGGQKCCRKDCLKLLKYLLEQLKKKFEYREDMDKFCSYHMKTTFLHMCTQHPDDSHWQPQNLASCFDSCVQFFHDSLEKERLQHFFIPGANLFSADLIEQTTKGFLAEQIEDERKKGFPILYNC